MIFQDRGLFIIVYRMMIKSPFWKNHPTRMSLHGVCVLDVHTEVCAKVSAVHIQGGRFAGARRKALGPWLAYAQAKFSSPAPRAK